MPPPTFRRSSWPRYESLVAAHLDAVHRTAFRLTGGRAEDAEDLVQETFYRVARGLDKFPTDDLPRPWVFRILHNAYTDTLRRAACRPQLVSVSEETAEDEPAMGTAAREETPTLEVTDLADRQKMEACFDEEVLGGLDTLSEEFRLPLLMHAVGELSYAEIAGALGCPIGTVMSRLSRARAILRERLIGYARRQGIVAEAPHFPKSNPNENA